MRSAAGSSRDCFEKAQNESRHPKMGPSWQPCSTFLYASTRVATPTVLNFSGTTQDTMNNRPSHFIPNTPFSDNWLTRWIRASRILTNGGGGTTPWRTSHFCHLAGSAPFEPQSALSPVFQHQKSAHCKVQQSYSARIETKANSSQKMRRDILGVKRFRFECRLANTLIF